MKKFPSRAAIIATTLCALAIGTAFRFASFNWNNRLQGDVGLFALTAREFVLHDRLYYPMKYEYSDNVEYRVLQSPASQHPPLWPFVAGLLGKLFSTDDTFLILKFMCEAVGASLIAIIAYAFTRAGWSNEALLSISGIALSPMLVDFSANGSSYIASAVLIVLSVILLRHFDYQKLYHYSLVGVLSGIGIQIHNVLILVPVAFFVFWFVERSQIRFKGILVFILTGFLVVAPWMLWNLSHFGRPVYSYSTYYLLNKLNLARTGLYDDVITTRIVGSLDMQVIKLYCSFVSDVMVRFLRHFLMEIGLFCLILVAIGIAGLYRRDKRLLVALVLTYGLYTITVVLWATLKYRFLVPLFPAAYIIAAFGFVELHNRRSFYKLMAWIFLLGTLVWGIPAFFDEAPTRYFPADEESAMRYQKMTVLVDEVVELEPGVVLGYADSLDGGRETVYYHRFPFVYGRGLSISEVQKLVHDFDVRYIWSDQATVSQVKSGLPEAVIILSNEFYYVFEIPKQ